MSGFITGTNCNQATLFDERLGENAAEGNAAHVINVFGDELELSGLRFRTELRDTGRQEYEPAITLARKCGCV